jgi:hypothetical protein
MCHISTYFLPSKKGYIVIMGEKERRFGKNGREKKLSDGKQTPKIPKAVWQ